MSVSLIWSLSNGGDPLSSVIDHGEGNNSNGDITAPIELFIRHDGSNEITDVGLYIRQYTDAYTGDYTAVSDIAEIIGWGDAVTEAAFGGFQCNLNVASNYPTASWPIYTDKSPTGGFVHRTGVGDSEGNAFTLPTTTGASAAGTVQTGSSPNVRFKVRVQVPSDETGLGIRLWDQVVAYTFTS